MDYKNDFLRTQRFLLDHEHKWKTEILKSYPNASNAYDAEWIEQLKNLSLDEQFHLELMGSHPKINSTSFKEYLCSIEELKRFPRHEYLGRNTLALTDFKKIKEKKRHEIQILMDFIPFVLKKKKTLIDIGGGVGHMANLLSEKLKVPTISLDKNQHFQDIGKKQYGNSAYLKFINKDFTNHDKKIQSLFDSDSFSIGLHTCGPLALKHFEACHEGGAKSFINFGCCYNKCNSQTEVNLSSEAHLELTDYALTLAMRYQVNTLESFKLTRTVKTFRYMLHIYLYKIHNQDFVGLGNSSIALYQGEFINYAKEQLKRVKISFNEKEILDFANNPEVINEVQEMVLANMIRTMLARPMERYILLDRCLYLQERGLNPSLKEYFHEDISPRNLGIFCL